MAADGGYFQKYGLDATLLQIEGPAMVPALLNGEINVMDLAAGAVVPAILNGADMRMIVSDSNVTVFGLVGTSAIQTIQDLKGKTVAISGRGQSDDFLFRRIFQMNGIDPDQDVQYLSSGGTPASLAVLEAGQAAAAMTSPPTLFQAVGQGFHVVVKPADLFPYQGSGLEVTEASLNTAQGQEIASRLVHAQVDAIQRIHSDESFAEQVLENHVSGTTPDVAKQTWDWIVPGIPLDGFPTQDGLLLVMQDLQASNPDKPVLTVDQVVDLTYLNQVQGSQQSTVTP